MLLQIGSGTVGSCFSISRWGPGREILCFIYPRLVLSDVGYIL